MKNKTKKEHLFPLDFVRVLAAVSIVLFHFNIVSYDYPDIHFSPILFMSYANGSMGHIGVTLFFILAGASLMYTYEEKLKPAEYFRKRFLAIYPLYWTVYAAFFVYFYLITRKLSITLPLRRLFLTVIGMDGYLDYLIPSFYLVGEWFVGCIILIYLMFPLLRLAVVKRPALTAGVTALLYVPLVYYYPFRMDIQFFFLIRVPEVLFGMYFIRYIYGTKETRARFDWRWGLASGLLCVFVFKVPVNAPVPFRILMTGIPLFLFLTWMGQLIRNEKVKSAMTVFSKYTFALFLVHHILVGKFLFPFSGSVIGRPEIYILFCGYLLFISLAAVVFYQISKILVNTAGALFSRWKGKTANACGEDAEKAECAEKEERAGRKQRR